MSEDQRAFARRMWIRFETYHDVTYFTPEARAATDALGCKGGWMGYFGTRAAPMGAASPEVVVSAFYNFHPSLVHRALPDAWRIATPEQFLTARLTGADGALRRMLSEVDGGDMAGAAALAVEAAAAAPTAGRPLAVANALLDSPVEPHLALWQATTLLRESRGDGHVAALIAADLDPCETLVIFGADRGLDAAYLRAARAWPEADWRSAADRLVDRGLLTGSGTLTAAGRDCRRWVEERTDQAATAPWQAIGTGNAARLLDLLTPVARLLAKGNDAMRANPMGLDAAAELAV
jgi:helix-turn-helix protein